MDVLLYFVLGAAFVLALAYLYRSKMSFIAQHPDDYDAHGHVLNLREHLNGPIICEGVLYGPPMMMALRRIAAGRSPWAMTARSRQPRQT